MYKCTLNICLTLPIVLTMILIVFLNIVKLAFRMLEMAFALVSLRLWLRHLNITQGVFCIDFFAWPDEEKKRIFVMFNR